MNTETIVARLPNKSLAGSKGKIIWVDDFIESLSELVGEMERIGYSVFQYKRFSELPANIGEFEFFVFDGKIGADVNAGSNFVRSGGMPDQSKIILYSGYIDPSYYRKGEILLDRGIKLNHYFKGAYNYSKSSARSVALDFSTFFDGETNGDSSSSAANGGEFMKYDDYLSLPFELQSKFNEDFFDKHKSRIGKVFDSGAVWALWFDGEGKPFKIAESVEDIPSDDEVDRLARSKNRIPFEFRSDLQVDDTSITNCSSNTRDVSTYPIVELDFGEFHRRGMHFDTGADTTYLNSTFVTEINEETFGRPKNFMRRQTGRPVTAKQFDFVVHVDLFDMELGRGWHEERVGSKAVSLNGWAVSNWEGSSFSVRCSQACSKEGLRHTGVCQFRNCGLIGRSIVDDNDLDFAVKRDTSSRRIVRLLKS
ncbi:hypothetical protein [Oceaniradius stylonematis]|jgi:hypothetical protein|uniref:hypothetical protein n=1 Tax=Oceaniradius stylonematis TaxID=2184161 RepID=UPI0035CF7071